MKCSRCGAEIGSESAVCGECGTPVAEPAQPAAQPPPSTPPAGQPYSPPTGQPYIPPAAQPYAPPAGQPYSPSAGQAYAPPAGQPYSQPGGPPPQQSQPPFAGATSGWPAGASYGPPAPRPAGSGQNLKVIAGILAIVAGLIVIAGAALPYAHLPTGAPGKYTSLSIFYAGTGSSLNNLWFAAEPVLVALAAVIGGIMLLASRRDILLTVVAAMLTALGTQTLFLFLGYAFGLAYGTNKTGPGGGVGMLGGFLLAGAGIVALAGEAGYFRRLAAPPGS